MYKFLSPEEKERQINDILEEKLKSARMALDKAIADADRLHIQCDHIHQDVFFQIEDEMEESGWMCTYREDKKFFIAVDFKPGKRSRFSSSSENGVCDNCGKLLRNHVDDDDRPIKDRRNYCYKRGTEKTPQ